MADSVSANVTGPKTPPSLLEGNTSPALTISGNGYVSIRVTSSQAERRTEKQSNNKYGCMGHSDPTLLNKIMLHAHLDSQKKNQF